jgi:hypothetical protein
MAGVPEEEKLKRYIERGRWGGEQANTFYKRKAGAHKGKVEKWDRKRVEREVREEIETGLGEQENK